MGSRVTAVLPQRTAVVLTAFAVALTALLVFATTSGAAGGNSFTVHNLVSDGSVPADHTDPNLVNGWGITRGPTTPWWVSDNGTDNSTLYQGNGTIVPLVVRVPGAPTGTVFNGGPNFVLHGIAPARFLFATEAGFIRGWNPAVAATEAVVGANRSNVKASYKGLAIASTSGGDRLYATDFHNGRVDVFNGSFKLIVRPGAFTDPNLPEGYGPFGIQTIGSWVYVSYAKQDADRADEVAGPGLGIVDVYDLNGMFLRRAITGGNLNAPWGMALAPTGFGEFGGDLLVGNFGGDGWINAYRVTSSGAYQFHATLRMAIGLPIAIEGLWGIGFGGGTAANGATTSLFFAAGPDDESHGLFGVINPPS
jgi:uncharacterized protein (TIGR03118 family)